MTLHTNCSPPSDYLYKAHKDSIGFWSIRVATEGDQVQLEIEHGKTLEGQSVTSIIPVKGKNLGRANETTPYQQALLELQSRVNKQLDKGYVFEKPEAGATATNTLGLAKPMLAKPIQKVKPDSIDWDNAFIQPKLDGHRALHDGLLYSRQGKELHLQHIREALRDLPLHLDGELYTHGLTLQQIGSLVKKPREESLQIKYHVYDCVSPAPYHERQEMIADAVATLNSPHLVLVPTFKVQDEGELFEHHSWNLTEGYEGTILRHGLAGYETDARSGFLLKVKDYQDAEFEVVGCNEGTPRWLAEEERWLKVAVYRLRTADGKEFDATAPGTMYDKDQAWTDRAQAIGKLLTVKFWNLSKDGVPQQPVALQFRDDV